jgi:hypothetical protein
MYQGGLVGVLCVFARVVVFARLNISFVPSNRIVFFPFSPEETMVG